MANEGAIPQKPEDILHAPYVLEFAGLEDKAFYHESDLESTVIDKMQKFLLEFGKAFCLNSVRSALRSTTKIFMLI